MTRIHFDCYSATLLASAFLLNVLSGGITYTFGLYHITFLEVFQQGSAITSWLGSINFAIQCASGPMASVLAEHIGIRWTVILGAVLSCLGLFITAFANNIYVVFVSLGLLTGVGFGLVFTMGIVAVALHFDDKHRPIAFILGQSGISVGAFLYPFLCEYLLDLYGWRGTMVITSSLALNMVAAGAVIRTRVSRPKTKKVSSTGTRNHTMWANWKYWTLHIHCFFAYFGTISFINHISSYAEFSGNPFSLGVQLLSIHAISGLFTRSFISLLVNCVNPYWLLTTVTLIPAVSHYVIAASSSFLVLCIGTVFHSFIFCAIGPVFLETLVRLLGPGDFAIGYGCLEVSMAAGALLGPPSAGFIYEETGDYSNSFHLTGSSLVVATICIFVLALSKNSSDVITQDLDVTKAFDVDAA